MSDRNSVTVNTVRRYTGSGDRFSDRVNVMPETLAPLEALFTWPAVVVSVLEPPVPIGARPVG